MLMSLTQLKDETAVQSCPRIRTGEWALAVLKKTAEVTTGRKWPP